MIGRYRGKGSVIRFNKRDGSFRWHAQFEKMSRIQAVSQAENDDDIFICGDYQPNEGTTDTEPYGDDVEYQAVIARMKDDGEVSWISTISGANPLASADNANQDRCMGVSYYKEKEQLAAVIQGKMSTVRDNNIKGNYFDTILVLMRSGGEAQKVTVISQGDNLDMYSAKNGIFWQGDYVFFAGWSNGYTTERQQLDKSSEESPDSDVYVYRYRFGFPNQCLFLYDKADANVFERLTDRFTRDEIEREGLYTFTVQYRSIPVRQEENYFLPYKSRYSGGFNLLDTMKIPRPCAFESQNLTSVQYYRGQNTLSYDLYGSNNQPRAATLMESDAKMIFQDGTDASSLATYDRNSFTIAIQTDEEITGVQRTIIRSCDKLNRLLEMNLYIEVLTNTYPEFVSEPDTTFVVELNEVLQYKLPDALDPEGNDEPEIYVGKMVNQEDKYPDFLIYSNETKTIKFEPKDKKYAGQTFYFTIVIKEKNSDSVKFDYYATVRVAGIPSQGSVTGQTTETGAAGEEGIELNANGDPIQTINYTIQYVDDKGRGSLKFTRPIHMKWLEENFYDFFRVYWRDTSYRKTREDLELQDFNATIFSNDSMTVNFTLKFAKPYRIGLLVKKSDRIHIDVQMDESEYGKLGNLWLGDPTTYKLGNDKAKHRLEMIFDFDNEVMKAFRDTAATMYWILSAIIVI